MFLRTQLVASIFALLTTGLPAVKKPHENNSLSFSLSVAVPTCYPGFGCLPNHPTYLGSWDARDTIIYLDEDVVPPKTSCPKKIKQQGDCPNKASETQFNTTNIPPIGGDSSTGTGKVYMNSVIPQLLYVAKSGLLQYTTAQAPSVLPEGAYGNLFNFRPATVGSCLNCGFTMEFNYTTFYTCFNTVKGQPNVTMAALPTNTQRLKKCSQYYALGGSFCTTKIPDQECGPNAYAYQ